MEESIQEKNQALKDLKELRKKISKLKKQLQEKKDRIHELKQKSVNQEQKMHEDILRNNNIERQKWDRFEQERVKFTYGKGYDFELVDQDDSWFKPE